MAETEANSTPAPAATQVPTEPSKPVPRSRSDRPLPDLKPSSDEVKAEVSAKFDVPINDLKIDFVLRITSRDGIVCESEYHSLFPNADRPTSRKTAYYSIVSLINSLVRDVISSFAIRSQPGPPPSAVVKDEAAAGGLGDDLPEIRTTGPQPAPMPVFDAAAEPAQAEE